MGVHYECRMSRLELAPWLLLPHAKLAPSLVFMGVAAGAISPGLRALDPLGSCWEAGGVSRCQEGGGMFKMRSQWED